MTASDLSPAQRLQKLAQSELAAVARELKRAGKGKDAGVHKARKAMQRLRSVLRLARRAAPEWAARIDRQIRRLRRRLGPLRDAAVRVELVTALNKQAGDVDAAASLQQSLLLLKKHRDTAWETVPPEFFGRLQADWNRLAKRIEHWPLDALQAKQLDRALDHARRRVRAELREALGSTARNGRHDLRRHLRRYAAMRRTAAHALGRRDSLATRLIEAARSLGGEGDLWLTCVALRVGGGCGSGNQLCKALEQQRRALCMEHDGELAALRRLALGKRVATAAAKNGRSKSASEPVAS